MARYVLRHTKLDLCLKTLASFSVGLTPKSSSPLPTIKLFPCGWQTFVSFSYDPMSSKITSFTPEQSYSKTENTFGHSLKIWQVASPFVFLVEIENVKRHLIIAFHWIYKSVS